MGSPVGTVDPRAQLSVIMRHVEDMAWRTEGQRRQTQKRALDFMLHFKLILLCLHTRALIYFLLTQFMCHGKRCLQPVILNNGAASVRIAHCADVRHAEGVTRVGATQVLRGQAESKTEA